MLLEAPCIQSSSAADLH